MTGDPSQPVGPQRSDDPPVVTDPAASTGPPALTDPPPTGRAMLDAVAVMDRLRSPGGCPWDAAQTHRSLAKYLLEETYETLDAIAADDPISLREELGDLLFQVLFHARLGEELEPPARFSIDDVAADAVAKLVRRHPHVFADATVTGADEVALNWDEIKKREKRRTSTTEGIALAQPALALSAKLLERSERGGVQVDPPAGDDFGSRLFALAAQAVHHGVDPELALRETALAYAETVREAEKAAVTGSASSRE